ncbi:MAG TPA: hypothetical protein GX504_08815 [Clostridia bacterium]|nr:hypothetical protein [Clostridia bacterium]
MNRIALLLLSYLMTRACLPWSLRLMKVRGLTSLNYLGCSLPAPAGLIPVIVSLVLFALIGEKTILFLALTVALLGLLDDLKGEPSHKGFRGHLTALKQGRVTTGFLKAAGGFMLALAGAWSLGNPALAVFLVNTLLIALMTNFLNLMDLRPGRAAKVFITGSALLVMAVPQNSPAWLFIALGAAVAYLPHDLHMKSMLGDTGANFWGFLLGLAGAASLSFQIKALLVMLLIGIHLYAEKYSISQFIEKTPWLNYLDRLGRPDYGGS